MAFLVILVAAVVSYFAIPKFKEVVDSVIAKFKSK